MKKKGFFFLNVTQFLGVLNDNLFKLLLIFMLLQVEGKGHSQLILSLAGGIFVIPFLLFSFPAGTLADRVSKSKIVVWIKVIEIAAAALGVIAFAFSSAIGVYSALFFLAFSGAVFGPSKYGIVPELVKPEDLSKANGYLSSFTFLAIIIGSALAGPLATLVNFNYFIASFFCLLLAFVGFGVALLIPRTPSANSQERISPFFFRQLFATLKDASKILHLLPAIFGSAYFLFVGGFTQLNIIPYAMECMHLTDVDGSYLFLVTALGIGLGSLVAGKLSGKRVELGLTPIGALGMTINLFCLGYCTTNLFFVSGVLFFLGFFGGIYLIPLDSYIQAASPNDERGKNVAANNFMGFIGVLLASSLLYLLGGILGLPPQAGFIGMGLTTGAIFVIYLALLAKPLQQFLARNRR